MEDDLRQCTTENARVHRYVAYDAKTGEPISSGGLTVFADLGFGFL
jgi:hypothetical protein